jgi:hypothetical protein
MRSERKNGPGNPKILEQFGWNLMIATGGLKEKETIGVRGILQSLAIWERRKEMYQVSEAFGAYHRSIRGFESRSPKFDAQPRDVERSFPLQLRNRAEEGPRIALDWIQQTHVDKPERLVWNTSGYD